METEYSKNLIYGNYLGMPNEAFPIDCETLAALQNNILKTAVIARIAGADNLILSGCKKSNGRRTAGYVYISDGFTGEILYHPDQPDNTYCHINDKTRETVTADNTEFKDAYVTRYLKDGSAGNAIRWDSFKDISEINNAALKALIKAVVDSLTAYKQSNNAALAAETTARESGDTSALGSAKKYTDAKIDAVNQAIEEKTTSSAVAFVRGMIMMWTGTTPPSGWALCNGQNGTPDLRNRFIVGAGGNYGIGSTGGSTSQSVTLSIDNMPEHSHSFTTSYDGEHRHTFKDYFYPENEKSMPQGDSYPSSIYTKYGSKGTDTDNNRILYFHNHTYDAGDHSHTGTTNSVGGSEAFSVSTVPPYYALAFIMKL